MSDGIRDVMLWEADSGWAFLLVIQKYFMPITKD